MPWSKSKLPDNLPNDFTEKQIETFISTANSALSEGNDEGASIAIGIAQARSVDKAVRDELPPLFDASEEDEISGKITHKQAVSKADTSDVTRDDNGNIEYRGIKFAGFNKPRASNRSGKDGMVLAKKGNQIKLIHFGDSSMEHNYSAEANDAYYARHGQSDDMFSAKYWSHRWLWPKGSMKGKGGKPWVPIKKYHDQPDEYIQGIVKQILHTLTSYVKPVYEQDNQYDLEEALEGLEDLTEDMEDVTNTVIVKFNEEEMIAIEPLYAMPMESDKHGEGMTALEIQKMVDNINKNIAKIKGNIGHMVNTDGYHFVKAWVNPCDCMIGEEFVPEGQPMIKVQFTDEKLWQMRKDGKLMGLSVGAVGSRRENPDYTEDD